MDGNLPLIVGGLQREIDAIKRELDLRGQIIVEGKQDMAQIRHRIYTAEMVIHTVIERIKAIEAAVKRSKLAEVLVPLLLVVIALVFKIPLADIKSLIIR